MKNIIKNKKCNDCYHIYGKVFIQDDWSNDAWCPERRTFISSLPVNHKKCKYYEQMPNDE